MESSENNWYLIDNIDEVDSPALVVYPERVRENIRVIKTMIDDPARLRPHIKTHKTKEAIGLMMEAGIRKFKCATIAEAELLAMCQAPDVLLAYQPVGPKLSRFISLIKRYPGTAFSCLIDNMNSAVQMADAANHAGIVLRIFIDLNIGMNRTGVEPGPEVTGIYEYCMRSPNLRPLGLHAYDGHIRVPDIHQRKLQCDRSFEGVEEVRKDLVKKGFDVPVIVVGGSPTFPIHAKRKEVECSPGTFIYWDKGYQAAFGEQEFQPAALVITRVISLPCDTRICLDLGHKSVSAENELLNRVYFFTAPELKFVGQSEEHLVMEAPAGHTYKIGDVLFGLPVHICPTCALYERALTVENKRVSGEWKMLARDRKINV